MKCQRYPILRSATNRPSMCSDFISKKDPILEETTNYPFPNNKMIIQKKCRKSINV